MQNEAKWLPHLTRSLSCRLSSPDGSGGINQTEPALLCSNYKTLGCPFLIVSPVKWDLMWIKGHETCRFCIGHILETSIIMQGSATFSCKVLVVNIAQFEGLKVCVVTIQLFCFIWKTAQTVSSRYGNISNNSIYRNRWQVRIALGCGLLTLDSVIIIRFLLSRHSKRWGGSPGRSVNGALFNPHMNCKWCPGPIHS